MASGIFAVLDDISALMDDVASMTKIAAKKTAGILGDDLAVNAEKATGFVANRELPILWAITKGSFLNKLIILPIAFVLSAFLPKAIVIILLIGGMYLAYEGAEKIYEFLFHRHQNEEHSETQEIEEEDIAEFEKKRIKGAVVTDFILSIEIIIIALGSVIGAPLLNQILVVSTIAIIATVGVYGIVALIVRMDDYGYRLINFNDDHDSISDKIGKALVFSLPWVIKSLSVIGTIALLLVSGGIFNHNIEYLHHLLPGVPSLIKDFLTGLVVGIIVMLVLVPIKKLFKKKKASK
jgi:predicted DNA repair protein MutK